MVHVCIHNKIYHTSNICLFDVRVVKLLEKYHQVWGRFTYMCMTLCM